MTSRSSTITDRQAGAYNPTPGEILLEEFLIPLGLSQSALARAIGVPPRRINEIVLGKRAVTADTDLRLGRYFSMSDGFFLNLQTLHELRAAKAAVDRELAKIRPHETRDGVLVPIDKHAA
ncbi:HigA family addiction module antitoxin [Labrys wisconsinensis]|uniref:Addiction module HigA family antidote n=1 Tax=Labrys wisconsinensis TaxID=425677 RepID=A0ABU0J948_9HYPH|nr:HigA family addiction module antitoxin [Labrys wisconsinensis]MDQ0469784.1 addiction module HigA family antidote [Labrys wisconsinensis]